MTSTAPRKTRIRNPEQTRKKLLRATIDLLAEKGADALSVKEVARVAKVSRGVAYQHFEDREHLLREAKVWISERLLESLAGELDPSSTEDRMVQVTRVVLNNREATRVLMADALAGKELQHDHVLNRLLVDSLQQFRSSGSARPDMDHEVLSYILLGSVTAIIMLSYQPGADVDSLAQRFTAELSRMLRSGIFKPEAPASIAAPKPKAKAPKR